VTLTSGRGRSRDAGPSPLGTPEDVGDVAPDLTALFETHYTPMLRVATVLLGDTAVAEDVVQEAFLALHTGWHRVRDKADPVGYLHRSVVNGSRSRLRRRAVAARFRPLGSDAVMSAEDAALSGLVSGPVLAAMSALPRREREAVLLRHYLDLSEQQTAAALGIRPGSVKGYASRGLATLRRALKVSSGNGQEQR
jgi:RNA polymerase sigma-70 factor (sigma-E family)